MPRRLLRAIDSTGEVLAGVVCLNHCNGSINILLAFSHGNVVLNRDAPPTKVLARSRKGSGYPMNSKDKVTVINDKTTFG